MNRPILILDYDGTISSYAAGWQGIDVCPDPPTEGLWRALETYHPHFTLHVHSSRSAEEDGRFAMLEWFVDRGTEAGYRMEEGMRQGLWLVTASSPADGTVRFEIFFPEHKPPAMLTLDDRAMTFTGVWPEVETLRAFQPWTRHTPPPNEGPAEEESL